MNRAILKPQDIVIGDWLMAEGRVVRVAAVHQRKVANLIRRYRHTLPACEMVITQEQRDRLARQLNTVTITPKEIGTPVSCHDCQHWQDGDDGPQCEYPDMPPCRE